MQEVTHHQGGHLNVIEKHRQERGWSKAKLARQAEMNAATVGWIESGRFRPYDRQLEKLAAALGLRGSQREQLFREFGDSR
jgi:ribosome-binding protein aMBF1 (putative translation factor)